MSRPWDRRYFRPRLRDLFWEELLTWRGHLCPAPNLQQGKKAEQGRGQGAGFHTPNPCHLGHRRHLEKAHVLTFYTVQVTRFINWTLKIPFMEKVLQLISVVDNSLFCRFAAGQLKKKILWDMTGIKKLCIFLKLIYFWLCWVFIAACGLSLAAASRGYSPLWCTGFSLQWLLLLWGTGSRAQAQ